MLKMLAFFVMQTNVMMTYHQIFAIIEDLLNNIFILDLLTCFPSANITLYNAEKWNRKKSFLAEKEERKKRLILRAI